MRAAMATKSLSLHGLPSPTAKKLSSSFLGAPASFLRPPALAATATPSRRTLALRAMAPPKPGGKPKKVVGIIKLALEAGKATRALGAKGVNSMAATAVSTASLPLPRRVSPTAAAHRPKAPSLRKRHCAVRPVAAASNPTRQPTANVEGSGRRHVLVAGAAALLSRPNPAAFAAEAKKGFLPVTDKKDGYSFLYPFGWQEVVVEGQDKVYKDVIEPLESVSVNTIPTSKQDIRELGPPDQVAEALIQKVLAPPTQKTKLIEAKERHINQQNSKTCI